MYFLYTSACVLLASVFVYYTPWSKHWMRWFTAEVVMTVKYYVLAIKELKNDWVTARTNKVDLISQPGRVAIITGGSRGIGAEVAKMLLQCDMEVIIACRRPEAGKKAIESIRKSGITSGQAKVYKLDNSSLKSVREFAENIKKDYTKVDILVNNAGIMFPPYSETEDGFEQQWGVNYLSHFLLTSLLLPLLKAGGSPANNSRIVNVSSCAHLVGTMNFDDINCKNMFVTSFAYAQSKLAQTVFTQKLQALLTEKKYCTKVYCVHPGVVNTDLFEYTYLQNCKWFMRCFFKTPAQGAIPIVYAATSKEIEESGGIYINNCQEMPVNPEALDPTIQNRLFQLSLEQAQLKEFF